MAKLKCSDYGFECDFESEGEIEEVIDVFGKHTDEVHGIDYSKYQWCLISFNIFQTLLFDLSDLGTNHPK